MNLDTYLNEALKSAHDRQRLPDPAIRRMIRERAEISQADLARAVGVGRASVARWEAGTRTPGRKVVGRYLEVLDQLVGQVKR